MTEQNYSYILIQLIDLCWSFINAVVFKADHTCILWLDAFHTFACTADFILTRLVMNDLSCRAYEEDICTFSPILSQWYFLDILFLISFHFTLSNNIYLHEFCSPYSYNWFFFFFFFFFFFLLSFICLVFLFLFVVVWVFSCLFFVSLVDLVDCFFINILIIQK